ncbi:MAG: succinate-semialdehyde dehydrogenase [Planctomycetota bacterium]|nr:MAG: succinate-semialdehyde dehydrogenase [Planctomycetota bacterium]
MAWSSVNPATGEVWARHDEHGAGELERRLVLAAAAALRWRRTPVAERSALAARVAELLAERRQRYAALMTREMGKPIAQAEAELDKCAWAFRHYAEHAEQLLAPQPARTGAARSCARPEPLGAVLAIMPWNFPFWQVARFLAPNLVLGNVALLKHAPNVPGCALAWEELLRDAGAPPGLLQALFVDTATTAQLIADERVRAVTLTGSARAGRAVGAAAGRALKKCVLELGGSDAFIVLEDADLERAAQVGAQARLQNNGQSCIAAKRFIVHEAVHDEFVAALRARLQAAPLGDPAERATELGPLARDDLRWRLHDQVARSLAAGARCLLGGEPLPGPGYFYPATLLVQVRPDMAVVAEETFGPVAAVLRAQSEDEAVALANATPYGLGASLWTREPERAERLLPELEVGMVFVNAMVRSDPRLPFGGVKQSGFGRELGLPGVTELANLRTVWID